MSSRAPHANLGRLFAAIPVDRTAAIELSADGGVRATSYGELDAAADGLARALVRAGIGRGERIAILSQNRIAYLAVLFGALRAGIVPVPINHRFPAERIAYVLDDADAKMVFCEAGYAHHADGRPVVDIDAGMATFLDPGPFEAVVPAADEASMILYTSGTTGAPKGVVLHHPGQIWAAELMTRYRRLSAEVRPVLSGPFFHKNALNMIKPALLTGQTMIVLPRFDVDMTIAAIRDHGATMLTGVPTMLAMLLQRRDLLEDVDTSGVRIVTMGSAPASDALLADIAAAFPNAEIHFNYGTTEGGPVMTGWYAPDGAPQPVASVGWPLPGCDFRFVDGPNEREGELWVKNPGVALGYHNLPDKTAERFVDGWYRTGDVLRLDDEGWMYFVGRTDDMFVVGGENVYPLEVEMLLERHPAIAQATVLPFPHETKGEVPYAFVVPAAGENPTEDAVKAFALENGPAYAYPRRVFVVADIPLTGTNKVDKPFLRALAERAPAAPGDALPRPS